VAGQGPRRFALLEQAGRRLARIDRGQARAARQRLDEVTRPETLAHTGDTPLPRTATCTATNLVHRPGGPQRPIVLDGVDLRHA
jgi:hypothetical protein